jgi:hypothetical protein
MKNQRETYFRHAILPIINGLIVMLLMTFVLVRPVVSAEISASKDKMELGIEDPNESDSDQEDDTQEEEEDLEEETIQKTPVSAIHIDNCTIRTRIDNYSIYKNSATDFNLGIVLPPPEQVQS